MPEDSAKKSAYLDFDGPLYFECVTTEQSEETSTATEHNVEKGANVSDHVREEADRVTLECFVSNHPLFEYGSKYFGAKSESKELDVPKKDKPIPMTPGAAINALTSAVSGLIGDLLFGKKSYKAQIIKYPARLTVVKDIVGQLNDWRKAGQVGKVYTPWKVYDSMIITHVAVKRDPSMGDAATISIDFQKIRLVETKLVTVPKTSEKRAMNMNNKGAQPASPVTAGDKSVALALVKKVVPGFGK